MTSEASPARTIGRLVLVGGLLGALVFGLLWAFNPDEEGGLRFSGEPDGTEETEVVQEPTEPEVEDEGEDAIDPEQPAEPSPEEPEPQDEELIAAAPEPEETSVQVLDAGGGGERLQAAADALEELGYQVVNVTSARIDVAATTVWFTEGNEDAALALRAREDRVVDVGPNEALSEGVDLHLLVGPDWTS